MSSAWKGSVGADQFEEIDPECGCAPNPAERRAFWPAIVNRRTALGAGAFGIAGAILLAAPQLPAAYAASYPSWDDVARAKRNQKAKAAQVAKIQGLIEGLQDEVTRTQEIADQRAAEFYDAQEEFFDAAQRADDLQSQADAQAEVAQEAADKAARLAVKLYRSGGDDTSLQLLFAGSAAGADDLLARLGQMDKLLEHNQDVYAAAVTARDSAQSLSDQAVVARNKRDELQKIAEQKMEEAAAAADAAQAALDTQTAHLETLEAQLAALQDETEKTVAAYKAGVVARRKARAERLRKERAAAAAAAKKSSGGKVVSGGWCRPNGGNISFWYGSRPLMCGPSFCGSTFHRGIDFAGGCGSAIYAARAGRVTMAQSFSGYGNYVRIDHGHGIGTGYGHIKPGGFAVRRGDRVSAGDIIAYVGNTGNSFGCHLHFEVYVNGNTVNPKPFLAKRGVDL
ncbi:MAG: peptidoglycan DD-metalloendopeptidase family protein [Microbacterium sp.]